MAGNTYNQKWRLTAEDRTKAAMLTAKQNVRGLDSAIAGLASGGGLLGALGIGAAGGLAIRAINETAASLDALAKRAHTLGMTSEELDAWDYAAQLSGSSAEGMEAALRRLPQAMYDAKNGSKMTADAFTDLGVTVTDEKGNLRDVTSVMLDISRGMEGLSSDTERAALAAKVMGKSGGEMVNMLKDGPAALQAMLVEAHSLGTRYDDLTVRGENYQDAQLRLNRSLRATKDVIVGAALPGLSALAEFMSEKLVDGITGLDREYREFLGTLRLMPGTAALEVIAEKQATLLAQLESLRVAHGDQADAAAEWQEASAAAAEGNYGAIIDLAQAFFKGGASGAKFYDEMAELTRELRALEDEEARVQTRMDLLTEAQNRWEASTNEAADAVDKLTDVQRAAAKVFADTQTPLEKYFATVDELDDHLIASRISEETYVRAVDAAGDAWDRANPLLQEHNQLMARGGQIADDVRTPYERYAETLAELDQLLAAGALNSRDYGRALVAAGEDYQAALADFGRAGTDSLTTVQEAGVGAARAMGNAFTGMVSDAKIDLEDLANFASQVMGQITSSLVQAGLVDPIVAGITAGSPSSQGGALPGGYQGPPAPTGAAQKAMPGGGAGGAASVTIQINAMDTAGAVQVLKREEATIVGMMQKAFNRRGLPGPMG